MFFLCLQAAFDSNSVDMDEYVRDVHCIAGKLLRHCYSFVNVIKQKLIVAHLIKIKMSKEI